MVMRSGIGCDLCLGNNIDTWGPIHRPVDLPLVARLHTTL